MGLTTTRELRWDAPGAPVLNGQVGSFYNLIKTFLVSCGWSIEWDEPANYKIALRNSLAHGGSGCYVRVLDDGSSAGGARVARMDVYESMTDIDTGSAPAGRGWFWKARQANANPTSYTAHGDERTFYLTNYTSTTAVPVSASGTSAQLDCCAIGAGDYDPLIPGDPGVFGAFSNEENPSTGSTRVGSRLVAFSLGGVSQASPGDAFKTSRNAGLSATATNLAVINMAVPANYSGGGLGGAYMPLANPDTLGYAVVVPSLIIGAYVLRGRMRGLFSPFNDFSGGGQHVGTTLSPVATSRALDLACLAASSSDASQANYVGRMFVERILSWDDV